MAPTYDEENLSRGRTREMTRALEALADSITGLDKAFFVLKTALADLIILQGREARALRGIPEDEHANPATDSTN